MPAPIVPPVCEFDFESLARTVSKRHPGKAFVCALIDLGDLHRSDRVTRILGRGYADGLVRAARKRMSAAAGPGAPVATAGMDCFALILPDPDWEPRLRMVIAALRHPLFDNGLPGCVTPVAGVVRFRAGAADPEVLLRDATAAALDARSADEDWRVHQETANQPHRRLRAILESLPTALASPGQLSLTYQPRIDLATGVCRSAEALIRWSHPVLGFVPPMEFIPVAEQTGMIGLVTRWVAERALTDLAAWTRAGYSHGVSINISAVNLAEDGFARTLGESLARLGADPARVELELTEGALMRNSDRFRRALADLGALGVSLSIDDFGTGYSNLSYLRDTPARALKIDQGFVRWLQSNERDPIIVRSMIDLAHALGYRVVAEGIEDAATMAQLAAWGCDEGQGYHIARPAPLAALMDWLAARAPGLKTPPP